ncbi:N-acetyl sugar amidotransferase [Adhaeribacter sp. BT258]|uniref:N-acetyl sugar amidotransferase n=2 Tax=Adhaeribacter terrigena TaxID=2793070 RepID=A0ABS1BX99_9BACT|nr:N-acetyl sugar amidotransferase [Adhaeribacter terrigena]
MDTTDPSIVFDENGQCNHCKSYSEKFKNTQLISPEKKKELLHKNIQEIKTRGKGSKYDGILGVSGGVDSTYAALLAKEQGLRMLIFHVDNGWNSEQSVGNIENLAQITGFDYVTNVLDWEEFRDIQLAYLKASVLDFEVPSDHAIYATTYKYAAKYNIKTIITGLNASTEGILPGTWHYSEKNTDSVNIKAIHKQFGKLPLKSFPLLSYEDFFYYTKVKGIKSFDILNYVEYNKEEVKKRIMKELGWRDYGGKHYESIITRFYQGYILPQKFGIDKRKAHLSTLIAAGQITREEALKELEKPPLDPEILKHDLEYVPKKLNISQEEFQQLMKLPNKSHYEYPTDQYKRGNLGRIKNKISSLFKA